MEIRLSYTNRLMKKHEEKKLLGKHKRNQMAQMQSFRRRSSTGIQIKLVSPLVGIQNFIEISMGEEDATAEEDVRRTRSEALDAVDEGLIKPLAAEFVNELVVIDLSPVFG